MAEIESSLQARADVELGLQRRVADSHIKLELARQRLSNLAAQVSETQRALRREQDRATSAEERTAAGAEALEEAERRLADAISGRAQLHVRLEREHALRLIAEDALQKMRAREAKIEERLRNLAQSMELALAALQEQLAGRRDFLANLSRSVEHLSEGLKPLLERSRLRSTSAPEPTAARSPYRDDQHLLFYVTAAGYELDVVEGPPPPPNAIVDIATHGRGVVTTLGRSPLPGDRRCCAYLLPSARAIPQNAVGSHVPLLHD